MDDNLAHCSYEVGGQYPFHTNIADECRPACSRTRTSPLPRTCGESYRALKVGELGFSKHNAQDSHCQPSLGPRHPSRYHGSLRQGYPRQGCHAQADRHGVVGAVRVAQCPWKRAWCRPYRKHSPASQAPDTHADFSPIGHRREQVFLRLTHKTGKTCRHPI